MDFDSYALVLLRRPADAPDLPEDELDRIQAQHLAHLGAMADAGKLAVAGPFSDQEDESLRGLCLYATSVEEARELAACDPAVQARRLEAEVVTWWTEQGTLSFHRP